MPRQCRQLAHRMAGLALDGRERTLGALLERFGRTGTPLGWLVALTAAVSQTSCRRRLNFMHRSREIYTKKIDMAYSRQFAHVKKTDKLSTSPRSWAYRNGVRLDFIDPGKPTQNAFIESFNSILRRECLKDHWFTSLQEARDIIEAWRLEYNRDRPHGSLGDLTPQEFATKSASGLYLEVAQ